MELLTDFMAELVNDGELTLARALRTKFIQKFEDRKLRLLPDLDTSGLSFSQKPTSLLSFKSVELAEQMTLLDAQLFLRLGKYVITIQFDEFFILIFPEMEIYSKNYVCLFFQIRLN